MLAERVELDVAHHDHALVSLLEHRLADHLLHGHLVALGEEPERGLHPFRGLDQPFAAGLLSERRENIPYLIREGLDPGTGRFGMGHLGTLRSYRHTRFTPLRSRHSSS